MTLVLQASFDMPENGFKRRGFLRVLRKRFDVGSDTFVGHRFHGSRGSSKNKAFYSTKTNWSIFNNFLTVTFGFNL